MLRRLIAALGFLLCVASVAQADPPRPAIAGVNWAHPANRNLILSIVENGGNGALDLVGHLRATVVGTWAVGTTALMGNTVTSNGSQGFTFPSKPTITQTQFTAWVVIHPTSLSVVQDVVSSSTGTTTGYDIDIATNGVVQIRAIGSGATDTACSVAAGNSYLVIVSLAKSNNVNCLVRQLGTNTINTGTSTQTQLTGGADNGTFAVAGNVFATGNSNAAYAAVLWSQSVMPLNEMIQLSADPWGPWRIAPISVSQMSPKGGVVPLVEPAGPVFTHP